MVDTAATSYVGGRIFNGCQLLENHCAVFKDGVWFDTSIDSIDARQGKVIDLQGDILSIGYTDLQVNGGGGLMLNDNTTIKGLKTIAAAHRSLGTTSLLPTLISETRQITQAAIDAVKKSIEQGVAGIAGLHLEGPHLSVVKKGAHEEGLIRCMDADDLAMLVKAAADLPVLKVTIAPENVTCEQVVALVKAGAIVSLGHTDAPYNTCLEYCRAGASCVTHLYNAMSQLGSREPGLVGAAIDCDGLFIGLIADGIHVHAAAIRAAWNAKQPADRFYLVTDAMAVAATDLKTFELNGRTIYRRDNRLTLADNTLAGADLDFTKAIKFMHEEVGIDLAVVLRAATSVPNKLVGRDTEVRGTSLRNIIRIKADFTSASPVVL